MKSITKAYHEFLDDLENIINIDPELRSMDEEKIVEMVKKWKNIDSIDLKSIDLVKIYNSSNEKTKKAISGHIQKLKNLSEDKPLSIEPNLMSAATQMIPHLVNNPNLQKIVERIKTEHNKEDDIVGTLRSVVNSNDFEQLIKSVIPKQ